MKYNKNIIVTVIGTILLAVFVMIVYFGFDFLCHIAEFVDYPVWKVAVLYFSSVFIVVVSGIVGGTR